MPRLAPCRWRSKICYYSVTVSQAVACPGRRIQSRPQCNDPAGRDASVSTRGTTQRVPGLSDGHECRHRDTRSRLRPLDQRAGYGSHTLRRDPHRGGPLHIVITYDPVNATITAVCPAGSVQSTGVGQAHPLDSACLLPEVLDASVMWWMQQELPRNGGLHRATCDSMTPGHPTPRSTVGLALALLLALGGCSPGDTASTTGAVTTAAVTTTQAPGDTVASEAIAGPGDFLLLDPVVGLDELASYTATLIVTFEGSDNGQAQQWASTTVMRPRGNRWRELTVASAGDLDPVDPAWLAEENGAVYELDEDGACVANVVDSQEDRFPEPAASLPGLIGAEAAGHETINEVEADGYAFDESALALSDESPSTGRSGSPPTAESSCGTSSPPKVAPTSSVRGSRARSQDYQLTDTNVPVDIALPEDCPAGIVEAPMLPDAFDVLTAPGFLAYDTASSLAEVMAFYQLEAPALGWGPIEAPLISETAAFVEFTDGDLLVTIVAIAGDSGTNTVQIIVGGVEE